MRMNMSDFATFFAVARNQSFRAAGDELGLSSSAISHSIKTLEQRLKIRLFNRTTRSVSLTEAGSNLYEQLRPAFDEIQIMLDEMNDFRLTPTGTLKINAARVAARIFLMPLLVGFTREYPDIKVELTTDDTLVDIVQQGFDAGVRLSGIVEKDMISVAIGPPVKLCVAATPEYFARYGKPRHPHDLLNHQCVVFRYPSGKPFHWQFAKELEIAVAGNIILDDVDAELEAVLMGIRDRHKRRCNIQRQLEGPLCSEGFHFREDPRQTGKGGKGKTPNPDGHCQRLITNKDIFWFIFLRQANDCNKCNKYP